MMDRFVAFDVEMPNQRSLRISAIGITVVEDGKIVKQVYSLINPETTFDPFVVDLIGITPEMVADKPTFPEFWEEIKDIMESGLLVAHGASSDMRALAGCLKYYNINWKSKVQYTCTCDIGLACYPYAQGHTLDALCNHIDFKLDHHNALSDSEGCARLLLDFEKAGADVSKYIYDFDIMKCRKIRKVSKQPKKLKPEEIIRKKLLSKQSEKIKAEFLKRNPQILPEKVIGIEESSLFEYAKWLSNHNKTVKFLKDLPHVYHEENNLHAILISKKSKFSYCVKLIEAFLPFVDNMETLALIRPKVFKAKQPELLKKIMDWLSSPEPYVVVFAIECAMRYFFDSEYVLSWAEVICSIQTRNNTVNHKRAELLSRALMKNEEEVLSIFKENRLDKWTHNMALQKAAFSKGITEEKRAFYVSLRR